VHAAELSANDALRRSVAAYDGRVLAECAGLLYLCRDLDGLPMAGLLDARATMTAALTLGYREAVAASDSVMGPAGMHTRGHEFHRTVVTPGAAAAPAWRWSSGGDVTGGNVTGGSVTEGHVTRGGRVHASYLHSHWAGLEGTGLPGPAAG
jgi:cobyrinic acid a,c-diamide synthase